MAEDPVVMSLMKTRDCQRGLTLIELMISLLIGALVLLGTVSLFQQSRASSAQDEQIARMQENGRFALRVVSRELSMLGYWGGILETSAITTGGASAGTDCKTGWMIDLDPSLEFESGATASAYPDCIADADILDGTDVLAIKRVSDQPVLSTDAAGTETGSVSAGEIYLKTNSVLGAVYEAGSNTDTGPAAVPSPYRVHAYLPAILYIRPWSTVAGDGIPTLVRETRQADDMVAEPLVEGIENLRIEFGVDGNDADLAPDYYVANPTTAELSDSVTARVYVLVRSVSPVAGYVNDKSYNLGSLNVAAANDNLYRRVYSTTVQLRNADKLKLLALN